MRKIDGLTLRTLGKEYVLVAGSIDLIDFDRIVTLNPTAVYVWESLPASGFDVDTMANLLTERYDVEYGTASKDARDLAEVWLRAGIIQNED